MVGGCDQNTFCECANFSKNKFKKILFKKETK